MKRRLAIFALALVALVPATTQAPASEQAAQALGRLKPQRPGTVDAYVVVVALDTDPVFDREAREAGRVLASRFDAGGRTIVLAEGESGDGAGLAGTPDNLSLAVARAASLMDREEDVLVLYSTSHGSPHAGLNYRHAAYGSGIIAPEQLASMLDKSGARNRLIILQACFSGQFVPALASPRTIVATAASSTRPSFGCTASNDWTFFGHALINQAMRTPDTFARQFRRALVSIIGWEQELGIEPSNPQLSIGSETASWLMALDARAHAVPSGPVGRPPSELSR